MIFPFTHRKKRRERFEPFFTNTVANECVFVSGFCVSTHVLGDISCGLHHGPKYHQHLQLWFHIVVLFLPMARASALSSA